MNITDEIGHKLLAYVYAAQTQGRPLKVRELDAYGRRPGRMSKPLDEMVQTFVLSPRADAGTAYLERLGWATIASDTVNLTDLGAAILRNLDANERTVATQPAVAIVLEQGSAFAFANVVAKVSELGECLLIDPYFSFEQMEAVFTGTKVDRILTGDRDPNRLKALTTAIKALPADGVAIPPIRVATGLHDRYIVPTSGPVWMLGTSLNGVGKALSTMVQLPDEPAGVGVRAAARRDWDGAKPLISSTAVIPGSSNSLTAD